MQPVLVLVLNRLHHAHRQESVAQVVDGQRLHVEAGEVGMGVELANHAPAMTIALLVAVAKAEAFVLIRQMGAETNVI